MRTIKWSMETGQQGAEWDGELEVEDGATDAEIDALVREEVFNIVSWGWSDATAEKSVEIDEAEDAET